MMAKENIDIEANKRQIGDGGPCTVIRRKERLECQGFYFLEEAFHSHGVILSVVIRYIVVGIDLHAGDLFR